MIDGIYVRMAIVALLLGIGCFGGCRWQGAIDAAEIETKDTALKAAAGDLRAASTQLRDFAGKFREIDRATAQNLKSAADARARAQLEAEAAERDRKAAVAKASTLQRQLAAERAGCVDGERPICGVPLR